MKLVTLLEASGYDVHNADHLKLAFSAIKDHAEILGESDMTAGWREELYELATDLQQDTATLLMMLNDYR